MWDRGWDEGWGGGVSMANRKCVCPGHKGQQPMKYAGVERCYNSATLPLCLQGTLGDWVCCCRAMPIQRKKKRSRMKRTTPPFWNRTDHNQTLHRTRISTPWGEWGGSQNDFHETSHVFSLLTATSHSWRSSEIRRLRFTPWIPDSLVSS